MWAFIRTNVEFSTQSFLGTWPRRLSPAILGIDRTDIVQRGFIELQDGERGWLFNLDYSNPPSEDVLDEHIAEIPDVDYDAVFRTGYLPDDVDKVSAQLGVTISKPWLDMLISKAVLLEGWSQNDELSLLRVYAPTDILDVNRSKDQSMGYADSQESGILVVGSDGVGQVYALDLADDQQMIALRSPSDGFAIFSEPKPVREFLKEFLPWM